MDTLVKAKPAADLRDYLAEERTFLGWVRTGIALMGFGFVVARFGIFLEQLHLPQQFPAAQPPRAEGRARQQHCASVDHQLFPLCVPQITSCHPGLELRLSRPAHS